MLMKVCPKCRRNLPGSEYNKSSYTATGLRSRCRRCQSEDKKAYLQKTRGKRVKKIRAKKYNIIPKMTKEERFMKDRLAYIRRVGKRINYCIKAMNNFIEYIQENDNGGIDEDADIL